jgi:hypothetical protein
VPLLADFAGYLHTSLTEVDWRWLLLTVVLLVLLRVMFLHRSRSCRPSMGEWQGLDTTAAEVKHAAPEHVSFCLQETARTHAQQCPADACSCS